MNGEHGSYLFKAQQQALYEARLAKKEMKMTRDLYAELLADDLIETTKAGKSASSHVYLRVRPGLVLIVEPIPGKRFQAFVYRATFRPPGIIRLELITEKTADADEGAAMLAYAAMRQAEDAETQDENRQEDE